MKFIYIRTFGDRSERHRATVDRAEGCAIFHRALTFVFQPVDGQRGDKLKCVSRSKIYSAPKKINQMFLMTYGHKFFDVSIQIVPEFMKLL
jgi:hypothetical protein